MRFCSVVDIVLSALRLSNRSKSCCLCSQNAVYCQLSIHVVRQRLFRATSKGIRNDAKIIGLVSSRFADCRSIGSVPRLPKIHGRCAGGLYLDPRSMAGTPRFAPEDRLLAAEFEAAFGRAETVKYPAVNCLRDHLGRLSGGHLEIGTAARVRHRICQL